MNLNLDEIAKQNTIDSKHKWGYQIRMVNIEHEDDPSGGYCGKLLILENEMRGGHHWHENKMETFIVLSGSVYLDVTARDGHGWSTVFNGILGPGERVTIQPKERHFMGNSFAGDTVILEVSTHDDDEDTYYVQ